MTHARGDMKTSNRVAKAKSIDHLLQDRDVPQELRSVKMYSEKYVKELPAVRPVKELPAVRPVQDRLS
ncbi:hypothetical protein KI688_008397 [Linnemannia hyalina]|uniref:Uncharacterized protein n=1 Tax=Linnemannia hyalina TaxID=64524 RepID=A0A9P8BX38_9FUNG|nr:hypothetical protein KI688_008397 [Linnemannia hyalina]